MLLQYQEGDQKVIPYGGRTLPPAIRQKIPHIQGKVPTLPIASSAPSEIIGGFQYVFLITDHFTRYTPLARKLLKLLLLISTTTLSLVYHSVPPRNKWSH